MTQLYKRLLRATVSLFVLLPFVRRVWSAGVIPFIHRPKPLYRPYAGGLSFLNCTSYRKSLRYYLLKRQTFEEHAADSSNDKKEYKELNFAAYMQAYKDKKATFEALRSFRSFYPEVPIYLLSDAGDDFSDIARYFNCEYEYDNENLGYRPCKDMYKWFARLARACEKFPEAEWIFILEDDIRTRDRISKLPQAHLSGQDGGTWLFPQKRLSPAAETHINNKYPNAEVNGIGGCGGSIFHRESFMQCFKSLTPAAMEEAARLDPNARGATDIALTFLFLNNGFLVRRWFDLSEDSTGNYGPGAAFDHQFKKHYDKELTDEDRTILSSPSPFTKNI